MEDTTEQQVLQLLGGIPLPVGSTRHCEADKSNFHGAFFIESAASIFKICLISVFVYPSMDVCVSACAYLRPEAGTRASGARVTGSCNLLDIGAGNLIQVPWKNSKHS